MRRTNDKILLESLVRKYGKNGVKNAIRRINENVNSDFEIKDGVLVKYHGNDRKVVIPHGVTSIGEWAFYNCTSLRSITIPDSVTSIEHAAFQNCSSLASITIPNSVTSIGDYAFIWCRALTSVIIPDGVTEIENFVFSGCTSLKSVTIPDSVTWIGWYVFCGCSNLTSFYGKFASSDNRCLIVDGVLKSFAPAGLTTYSIPNSVTTIGDGAFQDCTSLTSVTIPDNVTKIERFAFKGCEHLQLVQTPNNTYNSNEKILYFFDFEGGYWPSEGECAKTTKKSLKRRNNINTLYLELPDDEFDSENGVDPVRCLIFTESGKLNVDKVKLLAYFSDIDKERWVNIEDFEVFKISELFTI